MQIGTNWIKNSEGRIGSASSLRVFQIPPVVSAKAKSDPDRARIPVQPDPGT